VDTAQFDCGMSRRWNAAAAQERSWCGDVCSTDKVANIRINLAGRVCLQSLCSTTILTCSACLRCTYAALFATHRGEGFFREPTVWRRQDAYFLLAWCNMLNGMPPSKDDSPMLHSKLQLSPCRNCHSRSATTGKPLLATHRLATNTAKHSTFSTIPLFFADCLAHHTSNHHIPAQLGL
jgi:hypothetical protein